MKNQFIVNRLIKLQVFPVNIYSIKKKYPQKVQSCNNFVDIYIYSKPFTLHLYANMKMHYAQVFAT